MKRAYWFSMIAAVPLLTLGSLSFGDDDDDGVLKFWKKQPGIAPVINPLYKEECGSCHFAYQPGWLPEQSWRDMMSNLDSHFGDNAEVNPANHQAILDYLVNNSADKSDHRRSKKIMQSLGSLTAPQRITETGYFKHEHDEIPDSLVEKNDKVASLSHCNACHQDAEQGSFSEGNIKIPGHGKWDD
ncbi:MAG: diheme cytochrome c [Gammaproteobacteria bacterium]|nr:diheme cytochrome c [Gammaproteobacteria bacterium]